MPYTVIVYSKEERAALHRKGYWVDRNGNQIHVSTMTRDRLEKLVRLLATWAMDENDPILYLRNHPIFFHVAAAIRWHGLTSYHASMFELAAFTNHCNS